MLKSIIRTLLQKFIDDIDSDNCNITMEQQSKIISVLSNIANPDYRMSKFRLVIILVLVELLLITMLEMDSFRKKSNRKVLKNFLGIKLTQIYFQLARINSATSQKSGVLNSLYYDNIMQLFKIPDFVFSIVQYHSQKCILQCSSRTNKLNY